MANTIEITYSTVESIKENTSISNNVDPKHLQNYIAVAELGHVLPIIGEDLDDVLKAAMAAGTLSADQDSLIKYYIRPVSEYASWLQSTPFLYSKTTNKSIVFQVSDSSDTVDYETFNSYRNAISSMLVTYETRLKNQLPDTADCTVDHGHNSTNTPTIY